jgi:hypothetical protein
MAESPILKARDLHHCTLAAALALETAFALALAVVEELV